MEMQNTYNAGGVHAGLSEVADKGEVSHTENVNPVESIETQSVGSLKA